ncbi:MAG: hypothetical protein GY804_10005 [Alphaproteobacteria bacterium]|nr:hypothetical protein [Alphaproteobacteria bacterium]
MTKQIIIEKCSECPFLKNNIELGKQGYCIRHGRSILAKDTLPNWCGLPDKPVN